MTNRDFYLERRRAELPVFLNVLRAIPAENINYKPHERSPSAKQLLWTMTNELKSCLDAATHFKAEWASEEPPPFAETLKLFEQWYNALTDRVANMDDDSWNRSVDFYVNGAKVLEQPAGQFLWYILFDAIHHRGQLSAYLRPMGGKVPAIYGPSADSRSMT